ncbi:hypothetical protein PPTG_23504 [Phytophthora nicotianae INRA-310]|uniref:Uncharacterized protein n=1 Tax=Phytophthora nicotianae (strain INRA-310) TaxID=761204 RepID=W2PXK1_PHYN3|nr:hypothetical protein PPTG_23504 [Phytophthora nicotianae INRA-310]ETN05346.1 hypothetical protein PPTG_23504 [Phytophthora nicotianae INRA-310]
MKEANEMFRTWLVHLHGLLPPAPDGDWLEFRAAVVHLLPEFRELFLLPVQGVEASRMKTKLERETKGLTWGDIKSISSSRKKKNRLCKRKEDSDEEQ